jgi:hypothetical protein
MASTMEAAIERKDWEVVALCLLLGIAEVVSKLPTETVEQLLSLLEVLDD